MPSVNIYAFMQQEQGFSVRSLFPATGSQLPQVSILGKSFGDQAGHASAICTLL